MQFLRRIFGGPARPTEPNPVDEELRSWKIVSIENEKLGSVVIRLRIEKPGIPRIDEYVSSIEVSWPYESTGQMPEPDTKAAMDRFEIAAEELSGDNDLSYLIQVSTGMGVRRWLYYTRDVDQFMERFNRLMAESPAFPIKLQAKNDPRWSEWQSLLDDLSARDPTFLTKRPPSKTK